jgi:hypothetical protein
VPISEPTIRVGLFKSPDPIKFQAPFQYQVYAQDEFLGTIEADQMATVRYVNGTYTVTTPGGTFSSTKYLRLIPLDPANYFILPEYSRPYSAYKKNFNTYRGTLEYRFSPKSSQPYLINELPLDEYVAGVTETSNDSPIEYIKALVIAERSYGYVRIGSDIFDVYPNTTDQLYLGYNFEVGAGRIAQAARHAHDADRPAPGSGGDGDDVAALRLGGAAAVASAGLVDTAVAARLLGSRGVGPSVTSAPRRSCVSGACAAAGLRRGS